MYHWFNGSVDQLLFCDPWPGITWPSACWTSHQQQTTQTMIQNYGTRCSVPSARTQVPQSCFSVLLLVSESGPRRESHIHLGLLRSAKAPMTAKTSEPFLIELNSSRKQQRSEKRKYNYRYLTININFLLEIHVALVSQTTLNILNK